MGKIGSVRIRPDIYRTLVEDLVEEHWFPRNFALHLPEILPLLVDELPVSTIWSMVEEYLDALFSSISIPEEVIPGLDELPEEDLPARSISELIVGHLNHPCYAVANRAQRLCANLLSLHNFDMRSLMQEHLEANN